MLQQCRLLALAIGILFRPGLLSAVQPMHKARRHRHTHVAHLGRVRAPILALIGPGVKPADVEVRDRDARYSAHFML